MPGYNEFMQTLERPLAVWEWDVEKVRRALDAGVLSEDDRLELIEGELVEKMPQSDPHDSLLAFLGEALREVYGVGHYAKMGGAIRLATKSEPEPDVAIVRGRAADYLGRKPGPGDVRLIVEISHSTLTYDLGRKKAMYARYGIEEYHVYDLIHDRLEIFRRPDPTGEYLEHVTVLETGKIPGLELPLGPLLAQARGEII